MTSDLHSASYHTRTRWDRVYDGRVSAGHRLARTSVAPPTRRWPWRWSASATRGPSRSSPPCSTARCASATSQEALPGIAPNILTARLRRWSPQTLVVAHPYSERPPRFTYEPTAVGRELAGALHALSAGGAQHSEHAEAPATTPAALPCSRSGGARPASSRWRGPTARRARRASPPTCTTSRARRSRPADGGRRAIIPRPRGSELTAMRAVSKTVNPGSNPGSPALGTATGRAPFATGPCARRDAMRAEGFEPPRTLAHRHLKPARLPDFATPAPETEATAGSGMYRPSRGMAEREPRQTS